MSHFTVLVIGPDYEQQLAPFDEEISVEPYRSYWDSDTIEHWESILRQSERVTKNEPEGPEVAVRYPEDQILGEEYTLEDMRRVYIARYFDGDDAPYEGDPEDERPQVDDGGIFEWSTYNPKSKWDWYEVGGRWTGYFKLKPGAKGKTGRPGLMTSSAENGYVDIARKGDIDIEGRREERATRAAELWDRVHAVIGDLPEALSWEHYAGRLKLAEAGEDELTSAQAHEEYHHQPRVIALQKWNKSLPEEEKVIGFLGPDVEEFQVPREEFIERARLGAYCPYAYVYQGEWHAPGKMGWFGQSSDTNSDRNHFGREFNELLDSLPEDTELTIVDCHI